MPPLSLYVKTEKYDLPPNLPFHTLQSPNGTTIKVEAICSGHAKRLCDDFSLALEYGAVPAAQAKMIDVVREAEEKGYPLACTLSFGA